MSTNDTWTCQIIRNMHEKTDILLIFQVHILVNYLVSSIRYQASNHCDSVRRMESYLSWPKHKTRLSCISAFGQQGQKCEGTLSEEGTSFTGPIICYWHIASGTFPACSHSFSTWVVLYPVTLSRDTTM